jgi:hypothetical protein
MILVLFLRPKKAHDNLELLCAFFIMNNTGISWNTKDLTGKTFGKLTVLYRQGYKSERIAWLCRCECGNEVIANDKDFKKVNITCGCHLICNKKSKICAICGVDKPKSEYHTRNNSTGVQSKCLKCTTEYKKKRYWSNREAELKKLTKSRSKPENVKQRKGYYIANKEDYRKRYYSAMANESKKENKKKVAKAYRENNKEELRTKARKYSQTEYSRKQRSEYHLKMKKSSLAYNIKRRLRHRVRMAVRAISNGAIKHKPTMELLGCDIDFFKKYFEDKFTDGMSWERISEIHVDHIKPCSKFNLLLKEEQEKCFHFSNLQPLWQKDNLIKSDKYPYFIQS